MEFIKINKNYFLIFSLLPLIIFNSCSDIYKYESKRNLEKGNLEKALYYFDKYSDNQTVDLIDYELKYHIYKNILDPIFDWGGPIVIIDTTINEDEYSFMHYCKYIIEFENLCRRTNRPGKIAAIKFRTGQFEEAYKIYEKMYFNGYDTIRGINNDLKASLTGILLRNRFNVLNNSNLYYNYQNMLDTINVKSLPYDAKYYYESYTSKIRDNDMIGSLIKNGQTLKKIIDDYQLSEDEFIELYNKAIGKEDYSFAEIISLKLNDSYKQFVDFMKIWSSYNEQHYNIVENMIKEYKRNHIYKEDNLGNLVDIIFFFSKFNSNNFENILDSYIEIEMHFQNEKIQQYKNEEDSLSDNGPIIEDYIGYFGGNNELCQIREVVEYLVRKSIISERQIENIKTDNNIIKVLFSEMLLKKYLFMGDYKQAYKLSVVMNSKVLYGQSISQNTFYKIKDVLNLMFSYGDSELIDLKIKTFDKIFAEAKSSIYKYSEKDTKFTDKYISILLNSVSNIKNDLSCCLADDYNNIFQIYENNNELLTKDITIAFKIKKEISTLSTIGLNQFSIYQIMSYNDNIIYGFFNYHDKLYNSNFHYELIKFNYILHNIGNSYSDDFKFMYFSLFFNDFLFEYQFFDKQDFTEAVLNINNRINRVINQLELTSDNQFQMNYYMILKEKYISLLKSYHKSYQLN